MQDFPQFPNNSDRASIPLPYRTIQTVSTQKRLLEICQGVVCGISTHPPFRIHARPIPIFCRSSYSHGNPPITHASAGAAFSFFGVDFLGGVFWYLGSTIPTWSCRKTWSATNHPLPSRSRVYLLTMLNNLVAVSVGCAPTPIQYCALDMSSLMSLCSLPDSS